MIRKSKKSDYDVGFRGHKSIEHMMPKVETLRKK